MAYTAWSVTYGEQPTASKWNELGANDASFNDGSGLTDAGLLAAGSSLPKHVNVQNITTNAVVADQIIQRGWGFITFSGGTSGTATITLPVTLDDANYDVSISHIGYITGSDPTVRTSATAIAANMYGPGVRILSTSQFTVQLAFAAAATARVMFSWIAIGTKAR